MIGNLAERHTAMHYGCLITPNNFSAFLLPFLREPKEKQKRADMIIRGWEWCNVGGENIQKEMTFKSLPIITISGLQRDRLVAASTIISPPSS